MTDKELARAIGNLMLKQRVRIAAMTVEMDFSLEPRWHTKVNQAAAELLEVGRGAYEFSTLLQAIDSQDDCKSLLRILHQYISSGVVE